MNLKINAGEKVAVIGKIGSGKSTLLKLILGLYQPTNGSTLIDGANIQQIRPDDIRRQFGVVMQNTYLFSGSIRDKEIINFANETNTILVFSKTRHFRH